MTTANAASHLAADIMKQAAHVYQVADAAYQAAVKASYARATELAAALGVTLDALEEADNYDAVEEIELQADAEFSVAGTRAARSDASDTFCAAWADVLVTSGAHDRQEATHLASRLPWRREHFTRALSLATQYSGQ